MSTLSSCPVPPPSREPGRAGSAALDALQDFRPDVVFLDIGLPDLDAYEVARRLRARLGATILLVAVTGWSQEENRRRAKKAGFDHYLLEPVSFESLRSLVASLRAANA